MAKKLDLTEGSHKPDIEQIVEDLEVDKQIVVKEQRKKAPSAYDLAILKVKELLYEYQGRKVIKGLEAYLKKAGYKLEE